MGFLDIFASNVSNPALVAAMQKYSSDPTDDNLIDTWQKFLKAKVLLATTQDGAKAFGKAKQIQEAFGIAFHSVSTERGDTLLAVYVDSESLKAGVPESTPSVTMTGEQAVQLASGKGLLGMVLNPRSSLTTELKVWQHQLFIEKVSDATKLHALANKLSRAGNYVDAEGVLKGAIFAAQRDPGPQHPLSAELNLDLAKMLRQQGKLDQAEWIYRRALSIYEATGNSDLEVASTAEAIASLLAECGKTAAAPPLLQRALEIYERVPGGKPDSIARILCLLGDIKCEDGKLDEGEQLYKRASVTLEERKHPDVLGVVLKLGETTEKTEKTKEALAHYQRVITLFDSLKRGNELYVARAAQRAAVLHLNDNKPGEAVPLLERALSYYKREGMPADIEEATHLLNKAQVETSAERKAKEEAQSTSDPARATYGRASKRPADLPFLDMSAVKSNPKATLASVPKREEEAPKDVEDEALAQMRAFLDSVGDDAPKAKPPVGEFAIKPEPVEAEPAPKVEEPAPKAEEPASPGDHMEMDELFRSTKSTGTSMPALKVVPPVPPMTPAASAPAEPKAEVKPEPKPEPKVEAKPEPKPEPVEEPTHSISDKSELGKQLAADISGVFNKSVYGDVPKDDRFDKPIAERMREQETTISISPAEASSVEPPVVAPAEQKPAESNLFGKPIDGDISMVFNKSMLGGPENVEDRYNKPIQARAAEPAPEAAAPAAEAAPAPKLDPSRFDKPIQERTPEPEPAPEAKKAEEKKVEEKKDDGLFSDIDDSLNDAFASLMSDPDKGDGRFDKPISARLPQDPRFDTPIQDREKAPEPPDAPPPAPAAPEPVPAAPEPVAAAPAKPDLTKAKTPEELLQMLDQCLASEPQNSELWLRKGTVLAQLQKLDEAIKVFDRVTTMAPNDIKAWYCKGSSLHLKAQYEDAVHCFNYVLKLDADNLKAMMRKAECLVKLGRLDQSMVLYDRILVLQPGFVAGWLSKGRTLIQQRKLNEALTCYEHVLTIEPANEEALKAQALLKSKIGATA